MQLERVRIENYKCLRDVTAEFHSPEGGGKFRFRPPSGRGERLREILLFGGAGPNFYSHHAGGDAWFFL